MVRAAKWHTVEARKARRCDRWDANRRRQRHAVRVDAPYLGARVPGAHPHRPEPREQQLLAVGRVGGGVSAQPLAGELEEEALLDETAQKISDTERRSMVAERDTTDRYLAAYLNERKGSEFTARISGIAKFGVFARLDESGAEGLIPIRTLGREYFHYDKQTNSLLGSETGLLLSLGQVIEVRLSEVIVESGRVAFEL